jgi:polar amino acid transport system substrate-binding protein
MLMMPTIGNRMRSPLFLLLPVFLCLAMGSCSKAIAQDAAAEQLVVCYLEFPPYYYTNSEGEPDGFLLRKTDAILRLAGIDPVYESMPAKRIMHVLRSGAPVCSIGWFKTAEREQFAVFSRAIYTNKPLRILYLKAAAHRFRDKDTLASIMADDSLVLGLLEGYSLGPAVDALIARLSPNMRRVNGNYPQLLRMLSLGRFSCILVAPEEIRSLAGTCRLSEALFEAKSLSDIPSGNSRHLMFGRAVPGLVVERIDNAIVAVDKAK